MSVKPFTGLISLINFHHVKLIIICCNSARPELTCRQLLQQHTACDVNSKVKWEKGLCMKEPQENSTREAWILCLILGLVMINFPFIHIFNTKQLVYGIPGLILYFFIGWPLSIGVIWLFVRHLNNDRAHDINTPDDKADS